MTQGYGFLIDDHAEDLGADGASSLTLVRLDLPADFPLPSVCALHGHRHAPWLPLPRPRGACASFPLLALLALETETDSPPSPSQVEYNLTKHTSGRFQALRVKGEFGASSRLSFSLFRHVTQLTSLRARRTGVPLKGLSDERNAEIARRAHGRREASSPPSAAEATSDASPAPGKPRVVPPAPIVAVKQQQSQQAPSHGLGVKVRSPLAPRTA